MGSFSLSQGVTLGIVPTLDSANTIIGKAVPAIGGRR